MTTVPPVRVEIYLAASELSAVDVNVLETARWASARIWGTDMIQLEVAIWLGHSLWTWWVLLGYIIKKFSAGCDRKRAGCCHTTELVMSTPVHCQRGGIGRRWPGPVSNVIRKSKRIYCVKRQPEWSKSLHSCGCYFNLCLNIVADHLHNFMTVVSADRSGLFETATNIIWKDPGLKKLCAHDT